ncbi:uncharacterized protein LOC124144785 [Haliotis rufescens]|uniref:uncharacterized protein LOC124144785 n=1 Tax=Haliotis rufescens TaxID=6454 RepID=UPI001EAFD9D3|nr:uncharacterized protein LOC124144785 [Haliotis rufescens]
MRVFLVLVLTSVLADAQTQMSHSIHGSSLMHVFMMQSHHAAFELLDTNGDNSVTLAEFENYYDQYDLHGDGLITEAEFIQTTGMNAMMARNEFNYIDEDKNGVITRADISDIYKTFDVNHDNAVTEKEFVDRYGKIMSIAHQGMNIG